MSDDLDRVIAFALELDGLKRVLRGTRPLRIDRRETSAEHSWQVAVLAMALAPEAEPPVEIGRVIELLLVHDIPEIDAGDEIVFQRTPDSRRESERAAAERVFGLLPGDRAVRLLALWEEYEARQTPEARFAYAMDRLMPVLHELENGGCGWRENRVTPERVLAVNEPIGTACPRVWEWIRGRIEQMAASGWLESPEREGPRP